MNSIESKVEKFQLNCYQMATNDANELSTVIEEKINKNIKDEIELYKVEAENKYSKKSSRLDQNYNCEIFDEENNVRHKKIDAEDDVKNDLKNTVENKIKEFVSSENYKEYLIKNINKAIVKTNPEEGEKIQIQLTKSDFNNFENDIKEKYNCEIEQISNTYIGGSICVNKNKNISIDNTLKTLIEENL